MGSSTLFLLINLVGGSVVLGSYIAGLCIYPDTRSSLWGNLGNTSQKIFVVSMVVAAIGYVVFILFMGFTKDGNQFSQYFIWGTFSPSVVCALFLISSAIWMPATIAYINTDNIIWWVITVAVLWFSAFWILTLFIGITLSGLDRTTPFTLVTIIGLGYVTFHCLILDAIVWVIKFPKLH